MDGEKKERWMELCARAAVEQDPEKLHALVDEIDRLLQGRADRLKNREPASGSSRSSRLRPAPSSSGADQL